MAGIHLTSRQNSSAEAYVILEAKAGFDSSRKTPDLISSID
jgi:hypothetical protein